MLRRLLERFSSWLNPPRVIGRNGPYLSKYLLWGPPLESGGREKVRVYLHRFHRSDEDAALHSHPWRWAYSLVLVGGYVEHRRRDKFSPGGVPCHEIERRVVRPWSFNVLRSTTYHRVELLDGECWTLFVTGPYAGSWNFWSPVTGETTPWREFLARKGERVAEPWKRGDAS